MIESWGKFKAGGQNNVEVMVSQYCVLLNSVAAQKKEPRASLSFFEAEEAALVMRVVALCASRRLCCLFRHR